MPYTRRQLVLLLALVTAAGAGLALREWRARHPALVERLEALDRRDGPGIARTTTGRSSATTARLEHPDDVAELPRAGPSPDARLDLNRATADDLLRLPGIGPALAGRILEARQARGDFGSVQDLRRVPGFGAMRIARLMPHVTVGAPQGSGDARANR